jgi:exodeoxyribonuclease V beta subunit
MTPFTELDVFACPLDGIHLIEASAGTGKTWNICALYLRLLLEQGRTVEQILVVTFTNAATAELRDRIRGRIVETLNEFSAPQPTAAAADPFILKLRECLERTLALDRDTLVKRLNLARETFDEAAIFTIHGFCQRALAETPFSAGMPFDLELVQDDGRLIQQAVNDFWRRRVAYAPVQSPGAHPTPGQAIAFTSILASYLIQKNDDPGKYARLLRRILGKPLSRTIWPELSEDAATPDGSAVRRAYHEAQMIWQEQASAIDAPLLRALDQLNRTSYKPEAVSNGALDWNRWFESGQSFAGYPGADSKVHLYRTGRLQRAQKKNCVAPSHAFFDAAEQLCAAVEDLQQALAATRMRLLRTLVQTVPPELRRTKRQHRFIAFDDMLFNLYHALNSGEFAFLAGRLRAQYPVAMIDEFQDTDPLQFEIFNTLYRPGADEPPGTLFMVGDPKQAIYSFRNADLHTYLGAQSLATGHHTLAANQRSDAGLIRACNSLFGRNPRAFLMPGIDYRPVDKGQRPLPRFRDDSIAQRSPLQTWLLPRTEAGEWLSRDEAVKRSAAATAGEIARLLREARNGLVMIDGRNLRAGDVAVLVRSHAQGRRMRRALAACGIGSVELSLASVFRSEEAEEIERILLALLEPGRERLLRAALATELLGYDAAGLDALLQREDDFFDCMQRFAEYRQLWEQRGFAMMFRKLLRVEQVQTRLLQLDRPERRLTNVLHLAELLAAADPEQLSPDSLLRWLRTQRAESDAGDAAQLRLESDRNLVQIVTVHKSKGLEYPIVFCPFLWDGYRNNRSEIPDLVEYHAMDGTPTLDFRPDAKKDPVVEACLRDEAAAETVRLIYVAVTRAVHRCYLIAGCYTAKTFGHVSHTQSTRSMLNWLVAGNGFSADAWFKEKIEPEEIDAAWRELAQTCPEDYAVTPLPDLGDEPFFEADDSPSVLAARPAPGPILESWSRSSFSGMIRTLAREAAESDHDTDEGVVSAPATEPAGMPTLDDILAFPRGPAAGECLHHLFEHVDFNDRTEWETAIDAALATHPQESGTVPRTSFRPMLNRMLSDVLSTELQPGLRLEAITRDHRLSELSFTLPASHVQPSRLNQLLEDQGYRVGRLDFPSLTGYLSGAIDLVFRHDGRYYLLDWKSNYLGDSRDDYARARLDQAMTQHAYRLQYLIYTVALHRYLQRRCPGYRYERDFGGVFYLFVRGVRPEWVSPQGPAGVYFDQPSAETISMLADLLGDTSKAAA